MSPRRMLPAFASLLFVAAALAGCTAKTHDSTSTTTVTSTATGTWGGAGKAAAPALSGLTTDELGHLVAAFDDEIFTGGQGSPAHVWKFVSSDTAIGLHVNNDDVTKATRVLWVVLAVKGVFCSQAQPDATPKSFSHFHKYSSATWDGGHGGNAGDQGYWLSHVAVTDIPKGDMMAGTGVPWGPVEPGVDYAFMPTPATACGTVPAVNFSPADAGGLTAAEIATLNAAFNDQPFQGGQESDMHVAKGLNANAFLSLHWNAVDPAQATGLMWYVIGVRGEMCKDKQPHADFTHFHQWSSATWDGGHGGATRDQGYWLLHAAVANIPNGDMMAGTGVPWGPVSPGVDRAFMPTPAPAC